MAAIANSGVKVLTESTDLKSIPAEFSFVNEPTGSYSDSIPIIDFSLLTSGNPDERSKVIQELGKACEEWGFFVLVNHGIQETLMKAAIEGASEFFDLPEDEKRKYEAKHVSDPIKYGKGSVITTSDKKIFLWRDFMKSYVHPEFHYPDKPQNLREIIFEYAERSRFVARTLLQGISENLGLEEGYVQEILKLDSMFQLFAVNYYPPCPQPDQAIGLPPHTDHGLLTFLIHNGVAGLQIQHNGKWFNTNSPQNSILVNTADQLEIFSNGKYKSVKHRAVVNNQSTRISVVIANGPAPDAIVGPASPLVQRDGRPLYRPLKYIEYVETQLSNTVDGKVNLDFAKIQDN
ncbi:unnamed protein product [Fraxinus pennsylvanica]|uniref:Fe2OG dioxygenase domain-containing protein n=1 Tax=Fraxinus pennsylvanica TaxID=56036 RepID=A0AAD2DY78_9LAMI|nr:unnamed protein product [Fraxinus pennsylvanica]